MFLPKVVEKLIRGLAMEESKNLFSLFEHNSVTDRALESRVIVADVLAKFERYVFITDLETSNFLVYVNPLGN